jgi:hypothetical protein
MPSMNRREALKAATVLAGGVLVTSTGVLTACAPEPRKAVPGVLTLDDQELIEEIADTLLPPTPASPGAKAAGVGPAINLLLTDCYEPEAQRRVLQGLQELRAICHDRYRAGFASLAPLERERLLREIDAGAQQAGEAHWFGITRGLALRVYFTSEVGMTRALRYVLTPGRWEGCIPLVPGQPAWG